MKQIRIILLFLTCTISFLSYGQQVSQQEMQKIYRKVKTPNKYGLVLAPENADEKIDCPSVFREKGKWYMTFLVFNGRGYETWLAESKDLLHWNKKGKLMSFSDTMDWDCNQKAGYVALEDFKWGGSYKWQPFDGKYWMSYFGGPSRGYEKTPLSISIAFSTQSPDKVVEWKRLSKPVFKTDDSDVRWWEDYALYKSSVIWDKNKLTGYPFVMYYNANGDSMKLKKGAERIGMAVSNDMIHWHRYLKEPVMDHQRGITGDAVIQKCGNIYIMFYFGAFYSGIKGACNRFACSYDLVHWTDWKGPSLIEPSEEYDGAFAHKSYVVHFRGVTYHFYCAVNKRQQRGIAVATSKDLGKSSVQFIKLPPKKK